MKRSYYFIFTAVVAFIFGGMMFLAPVKALGNFGFDITGQSEMLIRSLGGMVFTNGILNLLVRNDSMTNTLKAVLIANIVLHGQSSFVDVKGVMDGLLGMDKMFPGMVAHILIGGGAIYYLVKSE